MGFVLIKESMSFVPVDWGISDGTKVHVYVVGSGAGGSSQSKSGTYYGKGGASGRGGLRGASSGVQGGGGGGGGGFGGGGGGAGGSNTKGATAGGAGGGAGELKYKLVTIDSAATAIAVTVGQPVAAATNGEASSFGSYLTAAGGIVGGGGLGGGIGSSGGGGGGGGAGGFQLGGFIYGGLVGASVTYTGSATDSDGTAGGAGATYEGSTNTSYYGQHGGAYGGGDGGSCINNDESGSPRAEDGYCFLGEPGQGCVLLMW